jgi:hypothetical protein
MQAEGDIVRFPREATAPPDFTAFFAEEHRGLFKALYFVTGNRADAQELMQEAFLTLWERWATIDRIDDPTGYLFRNGKSGGLWRANADGSDRRQLVAGETLFARWSPDGTRIADAHEGDNRIHVLDVAPGETTSVAEVSTWPEWIDDDSLLIEFASVTDRCPVEGRKGRRWWARWREP